MGLLACGLKKNFFIEFLIDTYWLVRVPELQSGVSGCVPWSDKGHLQVMVREWTVHHLRQSIVSVESIYHLLWFEYNQLLLSIIVFLQVL